MLGYLRYHPSTNGLVAIVRQRIPTIAGNISQGAVSLTNGLEAVHRVTEIDFRWNAVEKADPRA